jgi:hypothetical protein
MWQPGDPEPEAKNAESAQLEKRVAELEKRVAELERRLQALGPDLEPPAGLLRPYAQGGPWSKGPGGPGSGP